MDEPSGFNYQPQYTGYGHNFKPVPQKLDQGSDRSDAGSIWYITLLPILGLFLQNFAISKWAGMFLWAAVFFSWIIACVLDYRVISRELEGFNTQVLSPWWLMPPVYVIKRETLMGHDGLKGVISIAAAVIAIGANNFTASRNINEDSMTEILERTPVSSLENAGIGSYDLISDVLSETLGEYTTEIEKNGSVYSVKFKGRHGGVSTEVVINVTHDGFAYLGCEVESITSDGKVLEGDEFKEAIKALFAPGSEQDSADSSQADLPLPDEEQAVAA
ncbi:MAG: hypothetical protein IJ806_03450 [Ruminococcus sp.]|nr:hypothetical protein [Ruminococcus sp.]